jgi:hypothetical protein
MRKYKERAAPSHQHGHGAHHTEIVTPDASTGKIEELLETQAVEGSDIVEGALARLQSGQIKKKDRYKAICCCGDPSCRIGPFTGRMKVSQ